MVVCYLGAIWPEVLAHEMPFDRPLPALRRKYSFGANLTTGLGRLGHHVTVITLSMDVADVEKYSSPFCDVYIVPERKIRYQCPTLYCREVSWLRQVISQVRPDVVIANWTYQYARAGVTSGYPCLVVARDSPWRCLWQIRTCLFLFKTLYSQFLVFPFIKYLSTMSPHMVEDLRRFNRYKGEISVIPNGISLENEMGTRDIVHEAKSILCVSEWNRLKNSKVLFLAFEMLRKRHPEWQLIVVGNYMDDRGAGAWIRKSRVSGEGVELMGHQSQSAIKRLLKDVADVFCSPTLEESFGQVFLEAMAQGVPCVGGEKSGAVPWVMGDGGVTCDVTDPEKLAECLERVMQDYELRKELGENGIRRAKTVFAMDTIVKQYEQKLMEVAQCK